MAIFLSSVVCRLVSACGKMAKFPLSDRTELKALSGGAVFFFETLAEVWVFVGHGVPAVPLRKMASELRWNGIHLRCFATMAGQAEAIRPCS